MPPRKRVKVEAEASIARSSPRSKKPSRDTTVTPDTSISTKRQRSTSVEEDEDEDEDSALPPPKKTKKPAAKKAAAKSTAEDSNGDETVFNPAKKKRKTKEEKEAEAMPLAARSASLKMYVGAHVSAAKGIQNSIVNAKHIGGNAFALFLKSQRKWDNPALKDENITMFKDHCSEHKYDAGKHVLPHGSYLVNLASPEPDMATKAYNSFLDDCKRCDSLGIRLYNFHPGNTNSRPRPEALERIARALNKAHAATESVITVLENMAGTNNVIGATFEDLRDIIELVDDKSRVGVCLDTCHAHAAGHALDTPEKFKATLAKFDDTVGIKYLKALHLNDSKAPFKSHRDLHQNIGVGFLGLRAFHSIMNEPRFHGLPMILETPIDKKKADGKSTEEDKSIWANEIKLLESLIGMDPSSAEFKKLEKELANKGREERAKFQDAHDRKTAKEALHKAGSKASKGAMQKWLKGKAESDSEG